MRSPFSVKFTTVHGLSHPQESPRPLRESLSEHMKARELCRLPGANPGEGSVGRERRKVAGLLVQS
jgi:hypothetical protein